MRVAVAFFQSMFVIFALSFVPASFVVFLIGKSLQRSIEIYDIQTSLLMTQLYMEII